MKIDLKAHRELQEQGIISIQQHPELPLIIHNYTQRCQWEKLWTETTCMCRGLITDLSGNVVSRPFPKFFNLGEHTAEGSKLPPINWKQEFHVSEKMDGSLGVSYPTPDGPRIATRGSFVSEQAIRATAMLKELNWRGMTPHWTFLFEIVFPENRIVLDYGDKEALILLDIIHTESGESLSREALELEALCLGCEVVAKHVLTANELASYQSDDPNREGVVVRFADGTRIKIKLAEYCRLHKLITGVNSKTIWEMLRDGKTVDELLDHVPDEFFGWVNETVQFLRGGYSKIERETMSLFEDLSRDLMGSPRKAYAEEFRKHPEHAAILFLILDSRDYSASIWKMLKPERAMAFAVADEE